MAVEGRAKPAAPASSAPSVATDQMLAQVQERIEALEVKSRTDEEIERGLAADAQDALATVSAEAKTKTDPMAALESKYLELYQDLQRRQRNHERARQQLIRESDYYRKESAKLAGEKKKIEELCRTLTKERSAFRGQGQTTDASRGNESPARPSTPQSPAPARNVESTPTPALPPHITFVISSRYRRPLWFKVQRHTKLSSVFNNWLDRQDGSTVPADPPVVPAKANKKARQAAVNAAAKLPPKPKFIFTHAGKVVDSTKTAGEAGLKESDEIVAFELVDLTEDLSPEIPPPQVEKLKRYWSTDVKNRDAALEEILTTVCRQRLKVMLQQYDAHSELWLSILRNKELELQLFKARVAASEGRFPKLDQTLVSKMTLLASELVKFGDGFQNITNSTFDTLDYLNNLSDKRIPAENFMVVKSAFSSWHKAFLDLIERGLDLNRSCQGPAIQWTRPAIKHPFIGPPIDPQDLMNDVD